MKFFLIALLSIISSVRGQTALEAMSGKPCIFPFKYSGIEYEACTPADSASCWCPTQVDSSDELIEFEDCPTSAPCPAVDPNAKPVTPEPPSDPDCMGADDKPCVLPFKYLGIQYTGCTSVANGNTQWCATSVTSDLETLNYANCKTQDNCKMSKAKADAAAESAFSYKGKDGPENWGKVDPKCDGKMQSPINLDADIATDKVFKDLIFDKFGQELSLTLSRKKTVKAVLKVGASPANPVPTATGGPLGTHIYEFVNWQIHWGSEHTVDDKREAAEVHIVMKNKKYSTKAEALAASDGYTILAIFMKLEEKCEDASLKAINADLKKLSASTANDATTVDLTAKFKLNVLVPDALTKTSYYTYKGSMTTPNCDETVTWIVFKEVDKLKTCDEDEIKEWKKIIPKNYRPIQKLGNRAIHSKKA